MEQRRLYRSERDRMLGGVCGGLGEYFGVDSTLVRVAFVVLAFFSVGIVLYVAMWLIVPSESQLDAPPPEVVRSGVSDMRERAREGAEQASQVVGRLRGRWRGRGPLVPEPQPAPEPPPAPGSESAPGQPLVPSPSPEPASDATSESSPGAPSGAADSAAEDPSRGATEREEPGD